MTKSATATYDIDIRWQTYDTLALAYRAGCRARISVRRYDLRYDIAVGDILYLYARRPNNGDAGGPEPGQAKVNSSESEIKDISRGGDAGVYIKAKVVARGVGQESGFATVEILRVHGSADISQENNISQTKENIT